MRIFKLAVILWGIAWPALSPAAVPVYGYDIVHTYPHDPTAFTEGLFYLNGFLYESTGLEGHSTIRKVRLESGEVLEKRDVPAEYFGEGIVNWKDHLVSLTWKSQVGFVYDLKTFKPLRRFTYQGEGWALTQDGTQIYMSDGTPDIRVLNPDTLLPTRPHPRDARWEADPQLERARVGEGRDLRQCVADQLDPAHRSARRPRAGRHQSRADSSAGPTSCRVRPTC